MLRFRHFVRLAGDFTAHAVINRVWWLVPAMVFLAVVGVALTTTHLVVPYTVYTLI